MAEEKVKQVISTKSLALIGLMTAVCCVLGPISVPIGAVPVSLGVLAILLTVYVLGTFKGTVATLVYILLGTVGLPVFSGYQGGLQKVSGPTGGYIIGFIFLALIAGAFIDRFSYKKCYMHVVGMVLGLAVCYLFGTVWFMFVTKMGFVASLTVCVVPFLLFDALKIAFCFTMGIGIRKALTAAHLQVYYEDTKSN
ncbi:MAG: biotin transporter BioY [Lachnospiraceae bacterium]|nr:biotin transporter BioY [Lachnospiraceae bacterium]MBO7407176.1 biotin transporter BioY [Clostridia bacterium]